MNPENVAQMIANLVAGGQSPNGAVRSMAMMGVPADLLAAGRSQYDTAVGSIVELKDPKVLVKERSGSWYAGPQDEHTFWPPLRTAFESSLPSEAVDNVEASACRVVSLLRPPGAPEIRTRGLVLGHVQSGKTTSFQAVAALAADVGYRMIIVLSGITENLRVQTQSRVDEQLIGEQQDKWFRLTDQEKDFHQTLNAASTMKSGQRLIAVVKKNPSRLRRLAKWIESAGEAAQLGCPILVIDDEADQASIDVGKQRRSTINGLILRILKAPKAAYVAYTATPFANLLINPADADDLYPRDFVVALNAGSGYYGPERLFGRDLLEHVEGAEVEPDDVVRTIDAAEAKSVLPPKGLGAAEDWVPEIPESLRTAVDWFLLATAARRARGHDDAHSSMLVHSSMLADAHFAMQTAVKGHVDEVANALAFGDEAVLGRLAALWAAESGKVTRKDDEPEVRWGVVQLHLLAVLENLRVIVDNYRSTDRLEYVKGQPLTCIAIGGNTLSRGLTLEGLVSSYFVRAASAYDTLLQMGRWFGYRNGYSDLVRIWMTDELAGWFKDLATVEAEIRAEIERYELEDLKPSQLAVKIRTHPAMTITNAAKMKGAVQATLSYSGAREQTILFDDDTAGTQVKAGWAAGEALLNAAVEAPGVEVVDGAAGKKILRGVPSRLVLDFIQGYSFNPASRRLRPDLVEKYVRNELAAGELASWNVVLAGSGSGRLAEIGPFTTGLVSRTRIAKGSKLEDGSRPFVGSEGIANIKALVGSGDRGLDLPKHVLAELPGEASDKQILAVREQHGLGPLMVLYPIDKDSQPSAGSETRIPLGLPDDALGVALYFPVSRGTSSTVDYVAADLGDVEVEMVEDELAALDAAEEKLALAQEAEAQA